MKSVVHVQPHPGGGLEGYLDTLEGLAGYEQRRLPLSATRSALGAGPSIAARWPGVARRARAADLVHAHGDVAATLALPMLRRGPSVFGTHGLHFLRRAHGARRALARRALRAVVQGASRTICTSEAERDELAALVAPGDAERLVVVHNGVRLPPPADPADRAALRTELGLADDQFAVLFLGELEARKDPLTAVRAVETVRERGAAVTLLVAGEGPLAAEVARHAGPGVLALGFRRDAPRLLAASDVLVMPSRREGLSLAVLEAMSHGIPAVVSDGPGNPEAIGDAGLVVPAGDVEGFAQALAALAADGARRRELGQRAKARVEREFGVERMLDATRAVYEEVTGSR